ncbi:MAG: tetratricopeptide repeat protein [Rubripirellula sp.]|nr:tetratricopeptide repeat protein [Rubripirellula sp.]
MNRRSYHHLSLGCLIAALALAGSVASGQDNAATELVYPSKDFARLDTFEAVAVEDADNLFSKKDYKGAFAAYRAYTFEFAKGDALPYVLLRMGRCLHILDKRNTAIKAYQDVVDYFPDEVPYAAASLYYIGQCHAQNGNEAKSLATWARLAKDKEYVSQPRTGSALASLATAMEKRGDFQEATEYRWRTAVAFRESNVRAAEAARKSVLDHYAVRAPNQEKLLEFCNEVGGFGWRTPIAKPEESPAYWSSVFSTVLNTRVTPQQKADAARYWSGQMGDRFADNEPLRIAWFLVLLTHEQDQAKWMQRMETQFNLKPVTIDRVKQWLSYCSRVPESRAVFYAKYGEPLVADLETAERVALMNTLRHPHGMHDEATAVLRTVRTDGMDDGQLRDLAKFAVIYEGEEAFLRIVSKIKDPTIAARTRFDFYFGRSHRNGDFQKKALQEVAILSESPDQAQEIVWSHATLLQWQGQYEEAIKRFQAANRQPASTWSVIDCRVAMKQYSKAIKLTQELESLGGDVAASACFKAAEIYKISGDKKKEVQQLQLVLRRYPESGKSSESHNRLESYGVKIIGGEAKAVD